jgi:serine/threonine protein kinase
VISYRSDDQLPEFSRIDAKLRPLSPIRVDPILYDRPSDDILTDEEVECLRALNMSVVGVLLNEGQFSTIFEATHDCGVDIVIKRSHRLRQSYAELEALKIFGAILSHKNIIRFYGHQVIGHQMYLFLELADSGDLTQYLVHEYRDKDLNESKIFEIFSQVCDGLQHMHSNGYSHRDLKLQNILVSDEKRFKLCDFESADGDLRLTNGSIQMTSSMVGSVHLMAPEEAIIGYNSMISDVYSLGVILYQLSHSGAFPFNFNPMETDIKAIIEELTIMKMWPKSVIYLSSVSQELKSLLKQMLNPFPNSRITLERIVSHKWFVKQTVLHN